MYNVIIKDIQVEQSRLENKFLAFQRPIELAALELYKTDKNLAIEYLSNYSKAQAEYTLVSYRNL
jgi:hypothetical protein